jgi:tripartite-type tricarboxylate transporter receptor subunit TctC
MKKFSLLIAGVILFLGTGEMMGAEKKSDFPQGPISYLIGFAPGGKTDIQARGIAPYVEKYLGVRIVIQNFPGAGGRIGYTKLFKAKPDGYTIGILPLPAVILGEHLVSVEYKTKEFTPIFACFVAPQILVVAEDTYKSLDEFIKDGRSKPLTNATPGIGTSPHLAALVAEKGLGLKDVRHVHFESGGAAIAALAGKHVDFTVAITTNALPLVRAGKLKPLLVIADERDKAFPQVPIPNELGYKFTAISGIDGVAGPPNLPIENVKILEEAFAKAAADPEFLKWAEKAGMSIIPMDHKKYRLVVEDTIKEVEKHKEFFISK